MLISTFTSMLFFLAACFGAAPVDDTSVSIPDDTSRDTSGEDTGECTVEVDPETDTVLVSFYVRTPDATCYDRATEPRPAIYWLEYLCTGLGGDAPWFRVDDNDRCVALEQHPLGGAQSDPWLRHCSEVEGCCSPDLIRCD